MIIQIIRTQVHPLSSTKNVDYHNEYAYRDRGSVTSRRFG